MLQSLPSVPSTTSLLYPEGFLSPLEIDAAVERALAEDLGRAGDVTSIATIPAGTPARAVVVARKAGAISGLPLVAAAFRRLAPDIDIKASARDGDIVAAKTALMTIVGDARAVLSAERAALNLLGHLSGIATATAEFVQLAKGTQTRICCTRKTTPGLRALEKYAVRCGGGFNHRFGLDDAMLIKDNHIAVAGGVRAGARARARQRRPPGQDRDRGRHPRPACRGARDRPRRRGAARQHGRRRYAQGGGDDDRRVVLEASGGITLETIAAVAAHRRRLRLVRLDHAFRAVARRRARYRDVATYSARVASAVAVASPHSGASAPSPQLRGR